MRYNFLLDGAQSQAVLFPQSLMRADFLGLGPRIPGPFFLDITGAKSSLPRTCRWLAKCGVLVDHSQCNFVPRRFHPGTEITGDSFTATELVRGGLGNGPMGCLQRDYKNQAEEVTARGPERERSIW